MRSDGLARRSCFVGTPPADNILQRVYEAYRILL